LIIAQLPSNSISAIFSTRTSSIII